MSEKNRKADNRMEKSSGGKSKKLLMIASLFILLFIALSLKIGGKLLVGVTENMLKQQKVVVGTLEWERINAGIAGDVEIKKFSWRLPNGKLKAEVPTITLSYDFWNVLRRGAGVQAVRGIVFDRPHFYGVYKEGESLDLFKGINVTGDSLIPNGRFATEKEIDPTDFRGLLEIKYGKFSLDVNGRKQELNKVNIQSAFKFYPVIKTDITARLNNADIVLNFSQKQKSCTVSGEVKDLPVKELTFMYPDLRHIEVLSGTVPTLDIRGDRDGSGWHLKLKGSGKKIAGKACGMDFSNGEADFFLTREEAVINSFKCNVKENPVSVKGYIKGMRVPGEAPEFDLVIKATDFPLSAISKGMAADGATVNIEADWTGTSIEPLIKGRFAGDYIALAPISLTAITGDFERRADGSVYLSGVKADAAGGDVLAEGELDPTKGDFKFNLHGWGIDTAQLTANTLTGLTDFKCEITGEDKGKSATTTGAFRVRGGRWYYLEEGLKKDDTVRHFTGYIDGKDGSFGVKNAEMKLGRVKYGVDFETVSDGSLRVVILNRISSSLF